MISCTAKQPPKKDHGQSPLQVSIKSGNFKIAEYLLDCGADVSCFDSYGNSCLVRSIMDVRQILPTYYYKEDRISEDRIITNELKEDLKRIFHLLLQKGADINELDKRNNKTLCESYTKEPVAQFFVKNIIKY